MLPIGASVVNQRQPAGLVCATVEKVKRPAREKSFIPWDTRSYALLGFVRAQNFGTIRATRGKGRGTVWSEAEPPQIYDL
jgi:hypothetical protein